MERYSDYDSFARVYNRHWGPNEGGKAIPRLKRLFLDKLPKDSFILDLCCGAGHLVQKLIDEGYKVTGLDGSAELLKLAQKNAPKGQFILSDAREFDFSETYDAVVSVSDSLNHILILEELEKVFHNVFSSLKVGGIFHFDLNTENKYKSRWAGSFAIIEDDHVCAVKANYDAEKKIADFQSAVFEKQIMWERINSIFYQTWYPVVDVESKLRSVGFSECEVTYSGDGNPEIADKVFFVAKK